MKFNNLVNNNFKYMKNIFGVFLIAVFGFLVATVPVATVHAEGESEIFTQEETNGMFKGFLEIFSDVPFAKGLLMAFLHWSTGIIFIIALGITIHRIYNVISGKVEGKSLLYIATPILWWLFLFVVPKIINSIFKAMQSVA